jgi:ribonuclease HII
MCFKPWGCNPRAFHPLIFPMPVIIGVDEAGYGPNFGPLVMAATVWEVAEGIDGTTLYKLLRRVVASTVEKASRRRVVWADSKAVYKGGNGFDHLERGVLAALHICDCQPCNWHELWQATDWKGKVTVAAQCTPHALCEDAFTTDSLAWQDLPWHDGYSTTLPMCCDGEELSELSASLAEGLSSAGIRLIGVLARSVHPGEFNALIDELGNKSDALSQATLELVAEALQIAPSGPTIIYCDKHGARNRYHAHLQSIFAEAWIEVRVESDAKSQYRFHLAEQSIEIGFWTSGEQFLPVAVASMTAKYLREAAMRPFNEFWCSRVPGLKPTAGYPTDARRFKEQIAAVQRELNIADRILWRSR